MTKKFDRVPVLECAFALNIAKLIRSAKQHGSAMLTVRDGVISGIVILAPTNLTVLIDRAVHGAEIGAVRCLKGGARPLLKCPRAHEGNFQSLYYRDRAGTATACGIARR